jgi:hypothetical protein
MTQSAKALAKRFGSGGWCHVYLELRSTKDRTPLKSLLDKVAATDIEELTAGILSATVPVERVEELEKHAVVTPMERKFPSR